MCVVTVAKTKIPFESLGLSIFGYLGEDGKKYLSANPLVRETIKVCHKRAASMCNGSEVQSHFTYMNIGDAEIDLFCIDDDTILDTVFDFLMGQRGWWKKRAAVMYDIKAARSLIPDGVIYNTEGFDITTSEPVNAIRV